MKRLFLIAASAICLVGLLFWIAAGVLSPRQPSLTTATPPPSSAFQSQGQVTGPRLSDIEARLSFDPIHRIDLSDGDLLAQGKTVYEQACASCHGANLQGQANWRMRDKDGNLPAPPHDKTGHTWHHSDEVLFMLVKFGPGYYTPGYSGKMPAYDGVLSDLDIKAVNSWIASMWPKEILIAQRERTLASAQRD